MSPDGQDQPQIFFDLRIAGRQFQPCLELRNRFVHLSLDGEGSSQQIVGACINRIDLDRLPLRLPRQPSW
jgi:hypothetical protein